MKFWVRPSDSIPDLHYELACCLCAAKDLGFATRCLFLAAFFAFGSAHEELPHRFWSELLGAWKAIQPELNLNAALLADIEEVANVEPEDIDHTWAKLSWWQP